MENTATLERSSVLGPFPLPPVDDALRERARHVQGSWLVFEDPAAPTDKPLPKFAIQGGYEVSGGELTGRYQINPLYRPSPQVAGMKLNGVETILWRALNGYNPVGYLVDMLYVAELAVYAETTEDQRLQVARNHLGFPVLTAFTSDRFIPKEWSHHHLTPGWTIIEAMGHGPVMLDLNPDTSLALQIAIRDIALLVTDATRQRKDAFGTRRDSPDDNDTW